MSIRYKIIFLLTFDLVRWHTILSVSLRSNRTVTLGFLSICLSVGLSFFTILFKEPEPGIHGVRSCFSALCVVCIKTVINATPEICDMDFEDT